MALAIEGKLPSAKQAMQRLAEAEAEEATKQFRRDAEAAAAKKALIDHLQKPSAVSDEDAIRRAINLIERAIHNGQTEIQVHRFPNTLCTDGGRAINQQEPDWPSTLTGIPREIYQLWREAVIRALLYVGMPRNAVDERGFEIARRIRASHGEMPLALFKAMVREQFNILLIDQDAALAAIPAMLPEDAETRNMALALIRQVLTARGELSEADRERLRRITALLDLDGDRARPLARAS